MKIIERDLIEVLNDLPEMCMVQDIADKSKVICIKKGEQGYWPMEGWTWSAAIRFNERQGISAAQIEAMQAGSMFGFDVPGADPKNCERETT
mgnify:CR=1 FL=1